MANEDKFVCPRHGGDVRMVLRTLHSDHSEPNQVLGVYACPQCGFERRVPIETGRRGGHLAYARGRRPAAGAA